VIEKRSLKKTSVQTATFIPFSIDPIKRPFNLGYKIHQIPGGLMGWVAIGSSARGWDRRFQRSHHIEHA